MHYRNQLVFTTIFLLLSVISFAQKQAHLPLTKTQKDSLKKEVDIMMTNDQKYRWMMMLGEVDEQKLAVLKNMDEGQRAKRIQEVRNDKTGVFKTMKDSLGKLQDKIDKSNFEKISAIIYRYGFPPKPVKVEYISMILLHNREQLSGTFLAALKEEAQNGNVPGMEYAAIYDELQMDKKLPELYYVTRHYDSATNTFTIDKPKDLEATNKARKEIGVKRIKE